MRKFRTPGLVPPGGRQFFYHVPETETDFQNAFFEDLVVEVQRHYRVNGLVPPDGLDAIIEDAICRESPETFSVERR